MYETATTERNPDQDGRPVGSTTVHGDTIKIVCLSRAERANAIDLPTGLALAQELEQLAQRVKVVVLRSDGPIFSAGVDLAVLDALAATPSEDVIRDAVYGTFQRLVGAIARCPVPVIVELQGPALGAAADLVLAGDLCIASEQGWIEESWGRFGLIPALGGAFELSRSVGRRRALEILLTVPRMSATECHALGLVQRVVPATSLREAVMEMARRIAEHERATLTAMKTVIRSDSNEALDAYLATAVDEQIALIQSEAFGQKLQMNKKVVRSGDTN